MNRDEHPVWAVYDKFRTARLNVKYYCRRLHRLERMDRALDIILLIAAPTSAVAGLWFWETEYGRVVWQCLGVVAALVATVRPALHITKRIKDYESAISAYQMLEYDLDAIRQKIEQRGIYDAKLKAEFIRAIERQRNADLASPEKVAESRLLRDCTAAVMEELPASFFFVPAS
ncbi:hypothetical protein [Caballeronia grimmiae]|uniref:SMODS and SLOG-associating 2TM effector domain-containing protein n=1 Tax=Caballeronia grimmiae TaxID=1071679 RepID=A0A069NNU1_9BURK|nr:hypothetical protein [Caballeronia grimmiae]KDR26686.1 hypothetical protein BG57_25895 [Caballeronia grimmiae]GGD96628.1 hypothetical protein GCM10010985_59120 [Caballeronia grimmiae]